MTRVRSFAPLVVPCLLISCARPPAPAARPPSESERALVAALNELRREPGAYVRELEPMLGYFDGLLLRVPGRIPLRTREGRSVVEEAVAWLSQAPPAPRLKLDEALCRAARDHARDLGITGRRSHVGSDGSDLGARLRRHGRLVGAAGEAIAFGNADPGEVLRQLVIDDGIPDRGHRFTLMDGDFQMVGVACGGHSTDEWVCVLDFAEKFL